MKKENNVRVCIYPKDVQRITGKSLRYCQYLLRSIRDQKNKEKHQFITVDEFCKFTGLEQSQVQPHLLN